MLKLTHDLSTGLGRLARLTDDLGNLELKEKDRFNLSCWVVANECGTQACAVGWCLTFDWAKKLGLRYSPWHMSPMFKESFGWDAVADFFELSMVEAAYLFSPISHKQKRNRCPIAQAEHMREFLKIKGYYNE